MMNKNLWEGFLGSGSGMWVKQVVDPAVFVTLKRPPGGGVSKKSCVSYICSLLFFFGGFVCGFGGET